MPQQSHRTTPKRSAHERAAAATRREWITALARTSWIVCAFGLSSTARAQSAYCDKVQARANAEAALLMAPRLTAQVLRYPSNVDVGPVFTSNLQLRVGLAFSPVELYRGTRVMNASLADCEVHEAGTSLERDLEQVLSAPLLPALRAQSQLLESHAPELGQLLERAQARLDSQIITAIEYHDLRERVASVERKLEQLRGKAAELKARGVSMPTGRPGTAAQNLLRAQLKLEDKLSSLKALDAWSLRFSGGAIPQPDSKTDFYVWVDFAYSLGGPFNVVFENQYLDARKAELSGARYEVLKRADEARAQLAVAHKQAQNELSIVERQLAFLTQTRSALDRADAPATAHVRDNLVVEQITTESEMTYLHTLIENLATLAGGFDGSSG